MEMYELFSIEHLSFMIVFNPVSKNYSSFYNDIKVEENSVKKVKQQLLEIHEVMKSMDYVISLQASKNLVDTYPLSIRENFNEKWWESPIRYRHRVNSCCLIEVKEIDGCAVYAFIQHDTQKFMAIAFWIEKIKTFEKRYIHKAKLEKHCYEVLENEFILF